MRTSTVVSLVLVLLHGHPALGQLTATKLTPAPVTGNGYFGVELSLSGDYLLIASPLEQEGGETVGAVYIFRRDGGGWVREERLLGTTDERFGGGSISGDYAIIGSAGSDDFGFSSGSAHLFQRMRNSWVETARITASDGQAWDYFGSSVSLSGDRALIGAPGIYLQERPGAAYVFVRDSTGWREEARLAASDGQPKDFFGAVVSLDGDLALISSPGDDDHGTQSGSAYVFRREGSAWVEEAKLTPGDPDRGDFFGVSVSIAGDRAVVGSDYDDDHGTQSGSAYVFRQEGTTWIEEAKLTAADAAAKDRFGRSVSLSGDYLAVGSYRDDDNGSSSGSAYIFMREEFEWVEQFKLAAPDGMPEDLFGFAVALSENDAVVGSGHVRGNGPEVGYAYAYSGISAEPVVEVGISVSPDSGEGTFGYTIDLTNHADSAVTVDLWTEMAGPRRDRKVGRIQYARTLDAGKSYRETGSCTLDAGSPSGDYSFTVRVGEYPALSLSSASAPYTKNAPGTRKNGADAAPAPLTHLQSHPNPFNATTTIVYTVSRRQPIVLSVVDILGRSVTTLVNDVLNAGTYSVHWDAAGHASGIYFCRLSAADGIRTTRLLLVR